MTTPVEFGRLTSEESAILTRTGPGTPMGELFRRFWIPALLSEELPEPDCPPVRVKLLGEELVAFRDTDSRVGLLDRYCPHRGTDLFYGRNEELGLRCIFHGWKFGVEGNCMDMPTEPPESKIKGKIHARAYPTREAGGVVWAYMGPKGFTPQLPRLEWAAVPESHRYISRRLQACNWAQALEVDIDSAHVGFLHASLGVRPEPARADQSPRFEWKEVGAGLLIGARRNTREEDTYSWRVNVFLMPCYTLPPGGPGDAALHGHAWVPIDDESCWNYLPTWRPDKPLTNEDYGHIRSFTTNYPEVIPGTYRNVANRGNDFLIDRKLQRTKRFSGMVSTGLEDGVACESMGTIADRSREHLGISDTGIVVFRRMMLKSAKDLQQGLVPQAAIHGEMYKFRQGAALLKRGVDFFEGMKNQLIVSP